MIGQRLPSAWTKFSQYVRNRCASVGQPLPRLPLSKPWATVAQALGSRCLSIGQRMRLVGQPLPLLETLPKHWATLAQLLGNVLPKYWANIVL